MITPSCLEEKNPNNKPSNPHPPSDNNQANY